MASLRVVLYLGCLTGTSLTVGGSTYNLVEATFHKGAHFVLGTPIVAPLSTPTQFLSGFLNATYDGQNNVATCINGGVSWVGDIPDRDNNGNLIYYQFPVYYTGDTAQYLS